MFRLFLQILYETFLIPRRSERDMIKMYIGLHVKYPLFWAQFNETSIFATIFEKKSSIKFHKNPSIGPHWGPSCSMRTNSRPGRRTDTLKLIVASRNFVNAPKKEFY